MLDVLVDTDVLIDFSKGFFDALSSLFELQGQGKARLWVTPVVVAEFTNDQRLSQKDKMMEMKDFLQHFEMLNDDKKVGFRAGELLRLGQVNYLGDAMVAAVCLEKGKVLLTRNKKHFEKVVGLKFV
jgi:tRNA(fMet)-specific endonuclease VapC